MERNFSRGALIGEEYSVDKQTRFPESCSARYIFGSEGFMKEEEGLGLRAVCCLCTVVNQLLVFPVLSYVIRSSIGRFLKRFHLVFLESH